MRLTSSCAALPRPYGPAARRLRSASADALSGLTGGRGPAAWPSLRGCAACGVPSRRTRRRGLSHGPLRAGARARRAGQRRDRALQLLCDQLEIGEGVVVAEKAEAEVSVVAHDRDSQRLALRERDHGIEHLQPPPE